MIDYKILPQFSSRNSSIYLEALSIIIIITIDVYEVRIVYVLFKVI